VLKDEFIFTLAASLASVENSFDLQDLNDILDEVDDEHDNYNWIGNNRDDLNLDGIEELSDFYEEGGYASDVNDSEEAGLTFTFSTFEVSLPSSSDAVAPIINAPTDTTLTMATSSTLETEDATGARCRMAREKLERVLLQHGHDGLEIDIEMAELIEHIANRLEEGVQPYSTPRARKRHGQA
ncbi:hypothetical protein BGZ76_010855, partial [Entomortierella beljakovae]